MTPSNACSRPHAWSLLALLLAAVLPGCFFEGDDDRFHDGHVVLEDPFGTLVTEWTIEGRTRPSLCEEFRADLLELAIFDARDRFVTELEAPCEDFSLVLELEDGFYTADATLIDTADRAASTTIFIDEIDIIAGSELVVPIDFPADSFL